ncbi:tripartite tricarboxylate transporter TctB family protein [uncultured Marivita sp.]|uniref:tripartite tricarboxylate transporter TctB family protein n=1 Tax=uncultured Marivita sp. TaxID=888080 RepID=UPI0026047433|nr:tripartite tricarboxylate transporter TctB family protein [uncultured Marivita sp.]
MQIIYSERILVLLAVLIAAGGLFASTLGAEYRLLGTVQSPVFFPRIILGLIMGLSVIVMVQDLMAQDIPPAVEKWGTLVVFVIASLVFANAITRLGFMVSAVPFSALALWIFNIRSPLIIAAYAVAVPGSIVVLFNHILKLPLPTSPFTYFF